MNDINNKDIPNAATAFEMSELKSNHLQKKIFETQIKRIPLKIFKAINKGYYSTDYYFEDDEINYDTIKDICNILKDKGYTTEKITSFGYEIIGLTIKWNK